MNEHLLYKIILENLQTEDQELTELTGNGIFYAPELYIAFKLGKNIKKAEKSIFNQEVTWMRETNFENGDPTDFAFKVNNLTYAFELKLRDNLYAYKADVEKLNLLGSKFQKYFLALVDTWQTEKENDSRITNLENDFPELRRISEFVSFNTKQNRYKKQVCCTVGLWKIE